MPATRRSTRSAAAKGTSGKQSTLSFNNRVTKHSVAKPTGKDLAAAKSTGKDAAAAAAAVLTPPPTSPPTEKVEEEVTEESEEQQQQQSIEEAEENVAVQVEEKKPEAEIRAEKVTDAQIKRYWRGVEAARIAKRVHQEGLSVGEKVLRYFDISSQYGPCIGIDRTKRWYRAQRLGLNPPIEVLAVLLKEQKQGRAGIDRSAIDRLMESTAVGSL